MNKVEQQYVEVVEQQCAVGKGLLQALHAGKPDEPTIKTYQERLNKLNAQARKLNEQMTDIRGAQTWI